MSPLVSEQLISLCRCAEARSIPPRVSTDWPSGGLVGLPDERLAEIPAAYIEREGDVEVEAEELIAYTRQRLASFKVPRHIRFIDEWPMSASKIQKFKLRGALMDELGLKD